MADITEKESHEPIRPGGTQEEQLTIAQRSEKLGNTLLCPLEAIEELEQVLFRENTAVRCGGEFSKRVIDDGG